jgi:hypothetical protein
MIWIPQYGARRISVQWRESRVHDIPVNQSHALQGDTQCSVDDRLKFWLLPPLSRTKPESTRRLQRDIILSAN